MSEITKPDIDLLKIVHKKHMVTLSYDLRFDTMSKAELLL